MLYAWVGRAIQRKFYIILLSGLLAAETTHGWFQFTVPPDPVPVTLNWNNTNIEHEMLFQLRSCFGWNNSSCNFFNSPQTYYLTASDFNLSYDGSRGEDPKTREIAEAIFTQDSNTADLVTGQAGFSPGSAASVQAKMTFKVYNSQLYDALPGIYRANVKLVGSEDEGLIAGDDTAYFAFNINIPERLKISGLEAISPISLTSDGTTEVSSGWKQFCVFSQGGSEFQLRAYGQNDLSRFILMQNESLPGIPYSLSIKSSDGGEQAISPNAAESPSLYRWKGSTNPECTDGKYMHLRVNVDKTSATAGVYSDVVTIVVEPPVN